MIHTPKAKLKTKSTLVVAIVAIFAFMQAEAQVTFKPGLRAGVNVSHFTKGDYGYSSGYYYDGNGNYVPRYDNRENVFSSKTDFYIGFYGALRLTKYYTLQPEITYSNQGSTYKSYASYFDSNGFLVGSSNAISSKLNVSYLSVGMINKFNFNNKFNIHIGPTIDFVVDKNYPVDNDVDLAFLLGAGYNFNANFGIEARIKKGIVPTISDNSGSDHTNVVFSFGATYTFDTK